jgi:hypothetical protein
VQVQKYLGWVQCMKHYGYSHEGCVIQQGTCCEDGHSCIDAAVQRCVPPSGSDCAAVIPRFRAGQYVSCY